MKKTITLMAVIGALALVLPVSANTITPSFSSNAGGVWTYAAHLTSGQVQNGDGFTIFDFAGYVPGSIFAPAGWTATVSLLGSVQGAPPPAGYVDNPTLFNLLFTRSGGNVTTVGDVNLGNFGATSNSISTTFTGWSSKDHTPQGAVGNPHADFIFAPGVPDGGSGAALLGIAFAGIEAVRRFVRGRKA